jgi:hypothetical protein
MTPLLQTLKPQNVPKKIMQNNIKVVNYTIVMLHSSALQSFPN